MKQYLYVLIFLISFIGDNAFANEDALNQKLKSDMIMDLKKYHLAGMSVSYTLGTPASIQTMTTGYANLSNQQPMTPDAYFAIGSIGKAFVSAIIVQQVSLGKISLDEKLSVVAHQYPGKKNQLLHLVKQYPHLGVITLRQYLTHTSGIAQCINTNQFMDAFSHNPFGYWSSNELISIAMSHKPYFSPGEKDYYGYTNTDYIILGRVIEALTGKSMVDEMQEFLSQLGLNNSYYQSKNSTRIPKDVLDKMAHAYILKTDQSYTLPAFSHSSTVTFDQGVVGKDITPVAINYSTIGAASGGIIARTPTLVQWYWLLFHDRVVSKNIFPQMIKGVSTADPLKKYGLAIIVQSTKKYGPIYSHDGVMFGYTTNLLYVPQLHLILAVAANTSTDKMSETTRDIVGGLLKTIAHDRH